ncbi:hypothetical protein D038_3284B, partial [Vibrio parahaemolyticus IDH02189]
RRCASGRKQKTIQ